MKYRIITKVVLIVANVYLGFRALLGLVFFAAFFGEQPTAFDMIAGSIVLGGVPIAVVALCQIIRKKKLTTGLILTGFAVAYYFFGLYVADQAIWIAFQ